MTTWYADAAVASGGNGSQGSPWSWAFVATGASGAIVGGDTLRLKGPRSGNITFSFTATGASVSNMVKIRPWLGQHCVITGTGWGMGDIVTVSGNYIDFRSNPNPWVDGMFAIKSNPSGGQRADPGGVGFVVLGDFVVGAGCFVHDTDGGFTSLQAGSATKLLRMMSWNTGIDRFIGQGDGGTTGNGNYPLYNQNISGVGDDIVEQCIFHYYQGRFFYHQYGSSAEIANIKLRGNTMLGKSGKIHVGASKQPATNFELTNNWIESIHYFGYFGSQNDTSNGLIANNFAWMREHNSAFGQWTFREIWQNLTVENNILYNDSTYDYENGGVSRPDRERFVADETASWGPGVIFRNNQYYGGAPSGSFARTVPGSSSTTLMTFDQWRTQRGEAGSIHSEQGTPPDVAQLLVHPDFPDWTIVRIRNFTARANTVAVNISSVLAPGDTYAIYSSEDPLPVAAGGSGPVSTGTYTGAPVTFTMNNNKLDPIHDYSGPGRDVTKLPREIQAFHLVKTASGGGTVVQSLSPSGHVTTLDRGLPTVVGGSKMITPASHVTSAAKGLATVVQAGALLDASVGGVALPLVIGPATRPAGAAAPVNRLVWGGEATGVATTVSTAYSDALSVPFTATTNQRYAIFFFADLSAAAASADYRIRLVDNSGFIPCESNERVYAGGGWRNVGGFGLYTHGAATQVRQFTAQFATSAAATQVSIRNVRIAILELTPEDQIIEGPAGESNITQGTDQSFAVVNAAIGLEAHDVIGFTYGEINRDVGDAPEVGLGMNLGKAGALKVGTNDNSSWTHYFHFAKVSLSSTTPDVDFSFKAKVALAGDGARARHMRTLVLDVDSWNAVYGETRNVVGATALAGTGTGAFLNSGTPGSQRKKILALSTLNITSTALLTSGIQGVALYGPSISTGAPINEISDIWNRQQIGGLKLDSTTPDPSVTPTNFTNVQFGSVNGTEQTFADEGAYLILRYADVPSILTVGHALQVDPGLLRVVKTGDPDIQVITGGSASVGVAPGAHVLSQGQAALFGVGGLGFRVEIGHVAVVHDRAPILVPPKKYTVDDWINAVQAPMTRIARRAEIFESDGETYWLPSDQLDIIGGNVTIDMTRPERRMFDLQIDNSKHKIMHSWAESDLWYDKVVKIWRGFYIDDLKFEWQLGEFMIDTINEPHFPYTISLSGRDQTKKMLGSKLVHATSFSAESSPEGVVYALASNAGVRKFRLPTTGARLGRAFTFEADTDRWKVAYDIALAFNYELFFDNEGYLVMRKQADPAAAEVSYRFTTGAIGGNLSEYSKVSTDTELYNHIVVRGGSSNTLGVVAEVSDTNINSPTRIARIGDRVKSINSEYISTQEQATELAEALLSISALESYEIAFTSLVIPWLEAGVVTEFIDEKFHPLASAANFLLTNFNVPIALGGMSGTGKRLVRVTT